MGFYPSFKSDFKEPKFEPKKDNVKEPKFEPKKDNVKEPKFEAKKDNVNESKFEPKKDNFEEPNLEIKRKISDIHKEFCNSIKNLPYEPFYKDVAENILNNLKKKEFNFLDQNPKEFSHVMGNISQLMCCDKEKLLNIPLDMTNDVLIKIYKNLDDSLKNILDQKIIDQPNITKETLKLVLERSSLEEEVNRLARDKQLTNLKRDTLNKEISNLNLQISELQKENLDLKSNLNINNENVIVSKPQIRETHKIKIEPEITKRDLKMDIQKNPVKEQEFQKDLNQENPFNEKRISIEDSEIKQVYRELKNKNFTLKTISEKIGVDFRGSLYRGNRMSKESFEKLKSLIGRDIPHVISRLNIKNDEEIVRIQIEQSILKEVIEDLKERGYSQNKISKKIGTQIGNALRLGSSMNEESFKRLKSLFGKEIPHTIKEFKEKINHPLNLKENGDLAEMTCIILGDGHLHRKGEKEYKDSALSISLNRIEEGEYVNYVKDFMQRMFKINPELFPRKGSKGIDLKLHGDGLIDTLEAKGLMTGNKVKNQVSVPPWIKKEKGWIENNLEEWKSKYKPLVIRGLKGLVDTDGSIYVTSYKTININFRNGSEPLVQDFKEMCDSLDIRTSKVSMNISTKNGKQYKGYQVHIYSKEHVKNFINTIKPEKWKIKKKVIVEKLKEVGTTIEKALTRKN